MRIATSYSASRALEGIQERQFEQGRLQDQIATGLRIRTPGDDPLAAAQAEMARSRLSHNAQEKRAIQLGNALLSSADAAFADGIDELQVARDTLVAAANGSYGPSERKILAEQLRGVRISLLEVANSRDSAGGYVFSAQGSAGKPFPDGVVPVLEAIPGEQRIGGQGGYMASLDGQAWFWIYPREMGCLSPQPQQPIRGQQSSMLDRLVMHRNSRGTSTASALLGQEPACNMRLRMSLPA